jgi:hypothetical protein
VAIILVASLSFLLGLIALHGMFAWERRASAPVLVWTFTYFAPQHLAFGFGGLLVALFGQDWTYATLQGNFYYADGLVRFALAHLLALWAGVAGLAAAIMLQRFRLGRPPTTARTRSQEVRHGTLGISDALLQKICWASLGVHAGLIGLQYLWAFYPAAPLVRYWVDALARDAAPATFFLWGIWLAKARRGRVLFASYLCLYSLVVLATSGRGPILQAVLLFSLGYLIGPGRRQLRPRAIGAAVLLALALVWLFVGSGEVIRITGARGGTELSNLRSRIALLIEGWRSIPDQSGLFTYVAGRVGTRLVETYSFDVVARTPEWVPYSGWIAEDWDTLRYGWLPVFLFPSLPPPENDGPAIFRAYGVYFPPGETPGGIPVTVLADSFRRFGWSGVAAVHFGVAVLLGGLSAQLARRRFSAQRLLFVGAVMTIVSNLYTTTVLSLIVAMPRRLLIALFYSVALSWSSRLRLRARSGPDANRAATRRHAEIAAKGASDRV